MPLRLNDHNESVRTWRRIMNARFGGLYTRLHGPLPTDTDQFGPRAVEWQKEYQIRTHQPHGRRGVRQRPPRIGDPRSHPCLEPVCGVLHQRCRVDVEHGLPVRHRRNAGQVEVLASTHRLQHGPFPMNTGVQDGMGEFIRQLDMPRGARGLNCTQFPGWGFLLHGCTRRHGSVGPRPPWRPRQASRTPSSEVRRSGTRAGRRATPSPAALNSSGEGIATPTDHDLPDTVWDFPASKDMPGSGGDDLYTKMGDDENDQVQKNMRAVWDIVNKGNPLNLAGAVLKLLAHPGFQGGWDAAIAAFKALDFFVVKQTGPHVRYQFTLPIENDPRDCWEIARGHMADLVAHVPARSLAA
jgi:hypothetical protein